MIGLEPTFDEHLDNLVAVFREVRRVLRDDGTLWLNYGDAYTSGGRATYRSGASDNKGHRIQDDMPRPDTPPGLKPKDLMMMPARVAMALQADGWWLRSEIVWHKPNPMPESVTDRPTSAHEKLFLLSKSARYFYDAEAVRVPGSPNTHARRKDGQRPARKGADPNDNRPGTFVDKRTVQEQAAIGSNLRNVWTIPTHGYSDAHFATFPPALVEPCIKAGTSEKGCCAECGAPWVRMVESQRTLDGEPKDDLGSMYPPGSDTGRTNPAQGVGHWRIGTTRTTKGWRPSCNCYGDQDGVWGHSDPIPRPCTVLDPFGGSGTVALVADQLQRDAVLIEISPEYADMARNRIADDAPLFHETAAE